MSRIKLGGISVEETAAPEGLAPFMLLYPHSALHTQSPTLNHWHLKFHSMNSFVKFIQPLSPFNHKKKKKKMSFSANAAVAATWAEVGLRKRELSRLGIFRRNSLRRPPSHLSSCHLIPNLLPATSSSRPLTPLHGTLL